MNGKAAGHEFKLGVCVCGRRLADFRDLNTDSAGKMGFTCHGGTLTYGDINDINVLVAKMDEAMSKAMGW